MMNASRRSSRIFEIFSTKETSEHLVASKVRLDDRQRQRVVQEERQEGACKMMTTKATFAGPRPVKGLHRKCYSIWRTAMSRKSAQENWRNKSCPNESRISNVRIARQPRNENKQKAVSDFQTRRKRGPHR